MVFIAGGTFAAITARTSHQTLANAGHSGPLPHKPKHVVPPVGPLAVVSVSPAGGARHANGGAPITVTFSSVLAPLTPLPTLSPKIAGSWRVTGKMATFTPSYGYLPGTQVTLKIPGGMNGMRGRATSAGVLSQPRTVKFTTGSFATLRLQQVLAQLGYLPLNWTAALTTQPVAIPYGDVNAQLSAAYTPPAGTFKFRNGYPSELTSQWKPGSDNMLDQGAIRAFESDRGLTMDGVAGPQVWADLLKAAAMDKGNQNGYTYALASQKYPESLTVWHNGKVIEHTLVNTGIPGRGTQDGTFPVYLRYQFNYMDGTNPDGSKYHDPVYWISYFNGGDAVHYFARAGYGYYQSLGCVEAPWDAAKKVWSYMTYGTLVTVVGPEA
jgi:peptidoglycan hydrolase-like protein with peptidoglycan-binding domain